MKRTCRINDQMHKVSRFVVQFCLRNDLGAIVIGHNKGWMQDINLGKITNQNFVNILFNRLIQMIQHKAEEYGIKVIVREESYTSRQSALDFDPCQITVMKKRKKSRVLENKSKDSLFARTAKNSTQT